MDDHCSTVFVSGGIIGCDASWTHPGLNPEDDEQPFCGMNSGYHICENMHEVRDLGLTQYQCLHNGKPNTFYITKLKNADNIYGCGNINSTNNTLPVIQNEHHPFSYSLNRNKIQNDDLTPWRVQASDAQLIDNVYKINELQGGVLCCRYVHYPMGVTRVVWIEIAVFFVAFVVLVACLFKGMIALLEYFSFGRVPRVPSCCSRYVDDSTGIMSCCRGRVRIPVTRDGYRYLKRNKDMKRLSSQCKMYSELLDDRRISLESQCVICLDQYSDDASVMHLKCGHHFHKECCTKWLDEHENCPICLQHFQKAKNKHQKKKREKYNIALVVEADLAEDNQPL
eukprot:266480_1